MTKTFALPVSDCGCFQAGVIDSKHIFPDMPEGKAPPKFGVLVWYETEAIAKEACGAAMDAHWEKKK